MYFSKLNASSEYGATYETALHYTKFLYTYLQQLRLQIGWQIRTTNLQAEGTGRYFELNVQNVSTSGSMSKFYCIRNFII